MCSIDAVQLHGHIVWALKRMSCSILKYIKYDQYYYQRTPNLETLAWLHHGSQVIGIRLFIIKALFLRLGGLSA